MVRPNGHPVDETGSAAASSNVSVEDAEVMTTRIVDICLGLDLSPAASSIVTNAWKTMNDYEHSLNQLSPIIDKLPYSLTSSSKKRTKAVIHRSSLPSGWRAYTKSGDIINGIHPFRCRV